MILNIYVPVTFGSAFVTYSARINWKHWPLGPVFQKGEREREREREREWGLNYQHDWHNINLDHNSLNVILENLWMKKVNVLGFNEKTKTKLNVTDTFYSKTHNGVWYLWLYVLLHYFIITILLLKRHSYIFLKL